MDVAMALAIGVLLAPYCYIALAFLSVLSSFIPILKSLASHGKRRENISISFDELKQGKWISILNDRSLLVDKQRFVDFYILGFFWSITVLHLRIDYTTAVLYAHLLRRFYECQKIHKWTDAKMHVAGYILGCLHYFLLPFIFLPDGSNKVFSWMSLIYVMLNLFTQREQFLHHKILAECRRGDKYMIPEGRLYTYISSPHYLAEIVIYFTFLQLGSGSSGNTFNQTLMNSKMFYLLFLNKSIIENRHFIIFLWVACNLAVSAQSNQQWYKKHFPAYPKARCRLIPFVW